MTNDEAVDMAGELLAALSVIVPDDSKGVALVLALAMGRATAQAGQPFEDAIVVARLSHEETVNGRCIQSTQGRELRTRDS